MLSPDTLYPISQATKDVIFLKNFITNPNISIGDYTYYAGTPPENFEKENVVFGVSSKLTIGKFCAIAAGTKFVLNDANHHMDGFSTYPFFIFAKYNEEDCPGWGEYELTFPNKPDTVIGNDVWFGHESVIMPGVTIGNGCIIGSRAVVSKDLPPYSIAVGNPAKVIRKRFAEEVITQLEKIQWWNWSYDKISRNIASITGGDIEKLQSAS